MQTLRGKLLFSKSWDSNLAKILQGLDILAKTTAKQEPQHRSGTQLLISKGPGSGTLSENTLQLHPCEAEQDLCPLPPIRGLLQSPRVP